MKKGLILEGGAMRGLFSAGVMDVMMENGIVFDGAIGVSAGAAFGCNYKSGQIGRVIRYNTKYSKDKRYCSLRSLFKTGDLYGADFCYRQLPEELDIFDVENYRKSPMEFYAVATDIETGKPVYHKCDIGNGEDLEWFRASASLPLVARIVEIDGLKLLDGGISDSVPLKYFESIGYDRNIVILTQPYGYRKGKNRSIPFLKIKYRKYPKLIEGMKRRHEMYNSTLEYVEKREKEGSIFVIRPEEKLPIKRIESDPVCLRQVHDLGRKVATENLKKITDFLA